MKNSSPWNIWQCLEIILVVTICKKGVATGIQWMKARMLLTFHNAKDSILQERIIWIQNVNSADAEKPD